MYCWVFCKFAKIIDKSKEGKFPTNVNETSELHCVFFTSDMFDIHFQKTTDKEFFLQISSGCRWCASKQWFGTNCVEKNDQKTLFYAGLCVYAPVYCLSRPRIGCNPLCSSALFGQTWWVDGIDYLSNGLIAAGIILTKNIAGDPINYFALTDCRAPNRSKNRPTGEVFFPWILFRLAVAKTGLMGKRKSPEPTRTMMLNKVSSQKDTFDVQ